MQAGNLLRGTMISEIGTCVNEYINEEKMTILINMITLLQAIEAAKLNKVAIGHFNISDLATLKAIFESAKELSAQVGKQIPIIIGVSEGEREFMGGHTVPMRVRFIREFNNYPIFSNADHSKDVEKAKQVVAQGFDSVTFDQSHLSFEENVKVTKEFTTFIKQNAPHILVEGELGYIGSGSEVRESLPEGVALTEETITNAKEAKEFIKQTGVDLLAPAVGNIHGMLAHSPDPHLFIDRTQEIAQAAGVPLVLHGGSGTPDEDFVAAINAGVAIVHISTELRKAWRSGIERGLKEMPNEVAPYKLLAPAVAEIKQVVTARLKLFNKIK